MECCLTASGKKRNVLDWFLCYLHPTTADQRWVTICRAGRIFPRLLRWILSATAKRGKKKFLQSDISSKAVDRQCKGGFVRVSEKRYEIMWGRGYVWKPTTVASEGLSKLEKAWAAFHCPKECMRREPKKGWEGQLSYVKRYKNIRVFFSHFFGRWQHLSFLKKHGKGTTACHYDDENCLHVGS